MRICETCEFEPGAATCEICTEKNKRIPENYKSCMVTKYEEGKTPEWVWFTRTHEEAEEYINNHPDGIYTIEYAGDYTILRIMEEEGWE